jgi:hypothetical protein
MEFTKKQNDAAFARGVETRGFSPYFHFENWKRQRLWVRYSPFAQREKTHFVRQVVSRKSAGGKYARLQQPFSASKRRKALAESKPSGKNPFAQSAKAFTENTPSGKAEKRCGRATKIPPGPLKIL